MYILDGGGCMNPINMMLPYIENFGCSEPIFNLTLNSRNDRVDASLQETYLPTAIEGDPLSELVVKMYNESFDIGQKTFYIDKEYIARRALHEVLSNMATFVESNLDTKKPKLSKLYKFIRNVGYSNELLMPTIVHLYKYIYPHTYNTTFQPLNIEGKKHTDNALLILEALRKKYEK